MNSALLPLAPDLVALDVEARGADSVLQALAERAGAAAGLPVATVQRALERREQAAPTALGHGVAMPHARIASLRHPLTMLLRTAAPIAFRAPDRQPVRLFYAILVPETGNPDAHLAHLARVAEAFRNPIVRERLLAAADATAVREAFAVTQPG